MVPVREREGVKCNSGWVRVVKSSGSHWNRAISPNISGEVGCEREEGEERAARTIGVCRGLERLGESIPQELSVKSFASGLSTRHDGQ